MSLSRQLSFPRLRVNLMQGQASAGRRGFGARIEGPALALLALLNLATLLGLLATEWWAFEVLSHFAVQFALVQGVLLLVLLARRSFAAILLSLPFLALNLYPLAAYYRPIAAAANPGVAERPLRLMALNLRAGNERLDLVEQAVHAENPDVIMFSEVDEAWARRLAAFDSLYPYKVADGWIAMISRIRFDEARVLRLGPALRAAAWARICHPDRAETEEACLTLIGAHPDRPDSAAAAAARNAQLDEMAALAAAAGGRAVILGDLNTTPWSPYFRRLLAAGSLHDSALGRGVHPTWNSRLLPFGLPIDHVLVGGGIGVLARHVGADVGSDHYPLVADIVF